MNQNLKHSLFVSFVAFLTLGWLAGLCGPGVACAAASADDPNLADDDETSPLFINEVMAVNSLITDPQGHYEDWIELYNSSDNPVDVGGMYLTDDANAPAKWQFPTNKPTVTTIPAKGFLAIWADGDTTAAGLHAGLRLAADGDAVYLFAADANTMLDSVEFGAQMPNVSYGRYPDGSGEWQFLGFPSPGGPNIQIYEGDVSEVKFSHERGIYDQPFQLTLTCDTPDAIIFYSTDGGEPYREGGRAAIGKVYSAPLTINKTTCLRVRAIKPGWRPSPPAAQTYLFLAAVPRQSTGAPGFPSAWGGMTADYQMDPRVTNGHEQEILDGLKSLPTWSIVMTADDIFGASRGIYSNASGRGSAWERPASLEVIWPDGKKGCQANCGIRMYGDVGRQDPYKKKTFRLFFKGIYGQTTLRYPLFGDDAVDEFDQLILRANFNDGYPFGQHKTQFIRDEYARRLQLALGQPAAHGRFVHLYINGTYWGMYNPVERPDASFDSRYLGGEKEDWDVYKTAAPMGDSTMDSWNGLMSAANSSVRTNDGYQRLQGNNPDGTPNPNYVNYLDIDNYIDYMIINHFVGNTDWPHKNYYAAMNHVNSTGFKCFCWDTEWVMDLVVGHGLDSPLTENVLGSTSGIAQPYGQLRNNPEFRLRFADHVHKAFFNGGPLYVDPARPQWDPAHPEQNRPAAAYAELAKSIEKSVLGESARWGDIGDNVPHTKTQWEAERDYLLNTYMVQRSNIVMGQFRNAGLYPSIDAPVFQINGTYQHGGHAAPGAKLSMTGGVSTWYTLDGTDPRAASQGTTPGTTGSGTLVAENAAKRVLVPTGPVDNAWRGGQAFDDSAWKSVSGSPGGVGFERSTGYESFISLDLGAEMYNKQGTCYIRIPFTLSREPTTLDSVQLRVRYDDGFIAYLNGVEVVRRNFTGEPAWNSVASVANPDSAAIAFEDILLPNGRDCLKKGDNVLALQALNQTAASSDFLISVMLVTSEAETPTGMPANAARYSSPVTLTASTRVKARSLAGTTWSALNEAVYSVGPVAESLRISEIMYHPLDSGHPNDPNTEYIELTNIGSSTINLNLVRFTKGIDFTFPSFELPAGGYCLVVKDRALWVETQNLASLQLPIVGQYAGSLNNGGERLELVDAAGAVIESFEYDDNWFDLTDGMGFSLTLKSPQTADVNNLSDKSLWRPSAEMGGSPGTDDSGQVPELGSIVINELLANSQGVGPDWIELYNTTNQAIDVGGWYLSDDANDLTKYRIAAGTKIAAGGYLVLYENKHFGNTADPGCKEPFALSADGETLYLHSGSGGVLTGYSAQEKFDASEPGVTLGRWQKSTGSYNFVALSKPTPGKANAEPVVGPVVISEIFYHPADGEDSEFVELLNISTSPVTLYDATRKAPWQFTDDGGIELLFPADTPITLPAGGYLVLVKDLAAFNARFTVPAGVPVVAWSIGWLSDSGEKLQLSRPGDEDSDGARPWLRVDRVVYGTGSQPQNYAGGVDPWPATADGQGKSLSRKDPHAYGNDAENWQAADPSPGRANP
jgi:hypothetical protein